MSAYAYIHFDGPWKRAECRRLAQAVSLFESSRRREAEWRGFGKPWVAILCRVNGQAYYMANRQGTADCVKARSVDELAHKVRAVAHAPGGTPQNGELDETGK